MCTPRRVPESPLAIFSLARTGWTALTDFICNMYTRLLAPATPPVCGAYIESSQMLTAMPVRAIRSKQLSPSTASINNSPLLLPCTMIRFSTPVVRGSAGAPVCGRGGSRIVSRAAPMSCHLLAFSR